MVVTGYRHPGYAESLQEFGTPLALPHCGGWLLRRQIPACSDRDSMSCYPLFSCLDWSQLEADLEAIGDHLVSVAIVTDPFGNYDEPFLKRCFNDLVIPFKTHYVVALDRPVNTIVSSHHRRNARKAAKVVSVEVCEPPSQYLDDWVALYQTLIARHAIKGISTFSRSAFAKQLNVPGLTAFRAIHNGKTAGMLLWYIQGDVGYYHLGAYSSSGYDLNVSFALFWFAIAYFSDMGLQWLNLGAGAGLQNETDDGLSRFKRGWSTNTRTAYFCGRIFNPLRYRQISQAKGLLDTAYFPAYRAGEFA